MRADSPLERGTDGETTNGSTAQGRANGGAAPGPTAKGGTAGQGAARPTGPARASTLGRSPSAATPPTPPGRGPRRLPRLALAVIATGAVLVLTLVAFLLRPSGSDSSPAASDSTAPAAEAALGATNDEAGTVTAAEIKGPLDAYHTYVTGQLTSLRTQVGQLRAQLAAGQADSAKATWLSAHQTYHHVGAAYGAFGDAGDAIDGLADGLPNGVNDKDFTGFHAIEHALWGGGGTAAAAPLAAALQGSVDEVIKTFPSATIEAADLALRTHEILEGTARFQFTGADDYGSGTSLATGLADVEATRTLVGLTSSLLERESAGLPQQINGELDRLTKAIEATRSGSGWTPYERTTAAQRQLINAAAGGALEHLARVPALLALAPSPSASAGSGSTAPSPSASAAAPSTSASAAAGTKGDS